MVNLNNTIWFTGMVTEAVVVALLIYRGIWRQLPLFCIYCIWDLSIDLAGLTSARLFPSYYNWTNFLIQATVDSALQFCILVELAWSVLRPIREFLPRFSLLAIGSVILLVGSAIWPFTTLPNIEQLRVAQRLLIHLQQTVAILRILFFIVLAASSQVLSIGWRDRELQVATGLGIYSLISLGVTILQAHTPMGERYRHLYEIAILGFVGSLLYWVLSFAQKQAQRREFTPHMQSLLLSVAGVARAERVALTQSSSSIEENKKTLIR